jgi:hypothetical protein
MSKYNPKRALKLLKSAMQERKAERASTGGLVNMVGKEYAPRRKAEVVCFFLLEWLGGGLDEYLPDDMKRAMICAANVPIGEALRRHERPDGGVYIGSFELPDAPGSMVVVFGDPLMERQEAIVMTHQFRKYHAQEALRRGDGAGAGPRLVS